AEIVQPPAQNVERARLQQHPHARIRHVGRRLALLDTMEFGRAERPWPVPRHRRIILATGRVHFFDDAEVVIDFERARLDALAARAGALIRRRRIGFDDADGDTAPRQIARQHQAGRARAGDQDFYVGQTNPRTSDVLRKRTCIAPPPSRVHSITSSARLSTAAGMAMPSALATFRLTASSYLTGAWTGSVEELWPLRI